MLKISEKSHKGRKELKRGSKRNDEIINPIMSEIGGGRKTSLNIKKVFFVVLLTILFSTTINAQSNFYYYKGEKVYLTECMDKILIEFNSSSTVSQRQNVIKNNSGILQPAFEMELNFLDSTIVYLAVESNDESEISNQTITNLESSPYIKSVGA